MISHFWAPKKAPKRAPKRRPFGPLLGAQKAPFWSTFGALLGHFGARMAPGPAGRHFRKAVPKEMDLFKRPQNVYQDLFRYCP